MDSDGLNNNFLNQLGIGYNNMQFSVAFGPNGPNVKCINEGVECENGEVENWVINENIFLVKDAVIHPCWIYGDVFNGHDIGIAILEEAVVDTITPIDINREPLEDLYNPIGKPVEIVGYGYSKQDYSWDRKDHEIEMRRFPYCFKDGMDVKESAKVKLLDFTPLFVRPASSLWPKTSWWWSPNYTGWFIGNATAPGDSGGPALMSTCCLYGGPDNDWSNHCSDHYSDNNNHCKDVIIGVASGSDLSFAGFSGRVDIQADWIDTVIELAQWQEWIESEQGQEWIESKQWRVWVNSEQSEPWREWIEFEQRRVWIESGQSTPWQEWIESESFEPWRDLSCTTYNEGNSSNSWHVIRTIVKVASLITLLSEPVASASTY